MNTSSKTSKKPYGFWNWGTGIAIVIIVGALSMLWLVYKTTKVQNDMVTEDYYGEELKHDEKMEATKRGHAIASRMEMKVHGDFLIIRFPEECINKTNNGTLTLYRPSDRTLDRNISFELDKAGIATIETNFLVKGLYHLKADWIMDGSQYHIEKSYYHSN